MDQDNHDTNAAGKPAPRRWGRNLLIGGAVVLALAGTGLAVAGAGDFGRGMGMGGPGWHGMGDRPMHAAMGGFAERRFDRMMEGIDATPEQADKIRDIVDAARDDLAPMFGDMRDSREKVAALLSAPTIDRAAVEQLRAERVAALDEASKKAAAALVDAAEVLTPEQRAELAAHFKERKGHGRW